jgi:hypothetical protein
MSDLIPALIPWVTFQLAALGVLLSLACRMESATGGGRHRRGDAVPNRARASRCASRRAEVPLDGSASRLVRPYLPPEFCLAGEAEAA